MIGGFNLKCGNLESRKWLSRIYSRNPVLSDHSIHYNMSKITLSHYNFSVMNIQNK